MASSPTNWEGRLMLTAQIAIEVVVSGVLIFVLTALVQDRHRRGRT